MKVNSPSEELKIFADIVSKPIGCHLLLNFYNLLKRFIGLNIGWILTVL